MSAPHPEADHSPPILKSDEGNLALPTISNPRLFAQPFAELHLTFARRQCDERRDTA
jgi:hypothetical protein